MFAHDCRPAVDEKKVLRSQYRAVEAKEALESSRAALGAVPEVQSPGVERRLRLLLAVGHHYVTLLRRGGWDRLGATPGRASRSRRRAESMSR